MADHSTYIFGGTWRLFSIFQSSDDSQDQEMRDAQTARYRHHLLILYHLLHFCNEQGFHLNTQNVLHILVFQVTTLKQALNHRKCIKYQFFFTKPLTLEINPSEIPCAENSNLDISQCTRRNILKVNYQYYLQMAHQYNANMSILVSQFDSRIYLQYCIHSCFCEQFFYLPYLVSKLYRNINIY